MSEPLDLSAPEKAPPAPGLWGRLKRGLNRTHTELLESLGAAMQGRANLDDEAAERLEEALVAADLGVSASAALVARLRRGLRRGEAQDSASLREALRREVEALIAETPAALPLLDEPAVLLVVGVNGVGKTTTIAKLALREQRAGRRVLLAAGDTYRAAAGEQLELWSRRLGVELVRQGHGGDPAAVVFDAVQAAKARGVERLIVDTAGRLHTKENLMAELAKIGRVLAREAPAWQRRTWLVLDATTGQNAVAQAREFTRAVPIDGVILTKLDGTAKGGVAISVARELEIPIVYLGVGESAEDLVDFEPKAFASALLD